MAFIIEPLRLASRVHLITWPLEGAGRKILDVDPLWRCLYQRQLSVSALRRVPLPGRRGTTARGSSQTPGLIAVRTEGNYFILRLSLFRGEMQGAWRFINAMTSVFLLARSALTGPPSWSGRLLR